MACYQQLPLAVDLNEERRAHSRPVDLANHTEDTVLYGAPCDLLAMRMGKEPKV